MVSSGTVTSDAESIKSVLSSYTSTTSELSSSWKGDSAENFKNITNEFSSEYGNAIQSQMSSFASALNLYEEYKSAKKNLEIVENNYQEAVKANDSANKSKFASDIKAYEDKISQLKSQIEAALDSACSQKLEAVNYAVQGDFVNYYQYNYNNPYSNGTIANSGCGPTSLAMVLTYLLGKEITPVETAAKGNGTYTCSAGTYWSYFGDMAKQYGVNCKQMEVSGDNIVNNLKDGKTLIMSMRRGHFTRGGHFIVLRGIDENGKIIVADPNSEERSNQTWDLGVFTSEGAQIWALDNA